MKKGLLYVIITALVFTTLEPVSKLISKDVSPMTITFIRFLIGGIILLPFGLKKMKKENIKLSKKDCMMTGFLGILLICISMLFLQMAVKAAISPANVAITFSVSSVFTIILAGIILKEKITLLNGAGVAVCVCGLMFLCDFKSANSVISTLYALIAAFAFSLYTVLSKKMIKKAGGIIQASFAFLFGSIAMLIILIIAKEPIIPPLRTDIILNLLYQGFIVTGIGYWSYYRALDVATATTASLVFFIKPILTPFATFLINGIEPQLIVFVSLVLVLIGSYMTTVKKKEGVK